MICMLYVLAPVFPRNRPVAALYKTVPIIEREPGRRSTLSQMESWGSELCAMVLIVLNLLAGTSRETMAAEQETIWNERKSIPA